MTYMKPLFCNKKNNNNSQTDDNLVNGTKDDIYHENTFIRTSINTL